MGQPLSDDNVEASVPTTTVRWLNVAQREAVCHPCERTHVLYNAYSAFGMPSLSGVGVESKQCPLLLRQLILGMLIMSAGRIGVTPFLANATDCLYK